MKKEFFTSLIVVSIVMCFSNCGLFKKAEEKIVIKESSKVAINYVLKVDGKVVDSSEGGEPLNYTQGSGQIIPGLEKQLVGLKAGEKKNVAVAPAEGYGERNPDAVQKVERNAFKDAQSLNVGSVVGGSVQGQEFQAVVVALDDKEVTLDLNHPLAGKTLDFEIEIVSVQ